MNHIVSWGLAGHKMELIPPGDLVISGWQVNENLTTESLGTRATISINLPVVLDLFEFLQTHEVELRQEFEEIAASMKEIDEYYREHEDEDTNEGDIS